MTDSISALNLEPGQMVGGYTLVSRLGGGAMGTVWTVKDGAGQLFAMKILRDSLSDDADPDSSEAREQVTARERLRREALALSKVRHPGVASIVDMELDDALAFIVTELIDGDTLREDVEKNGAYTGEDLELLTEKLSSAVDAVHKAGIIHRDIKPTNVMISATGPVLVDFGIAMGEGESHVTRTGLVMGTPGFIAPEVIDGAESDAATDWWSVASVLGFAATGKPIFGTKPIMAVLEREAAGSADLSGLPARTVAAFRAALNPDRAQRIDHMQLLNAIRFDALHPSGTNDAGVVRPFDAAANATGVATGLAGGMRRAWQKDPDDQPTQTINEATAPIGKTDEAGTQVLPSDPNDRPGSTRVMAQVPLPNQEDSAATVAVPTAAPASNPLERLRQDVPQTQQANPDYASAPPAEPLTQVEAPVANAPADAQYEPTEQPAPAPVVIPPREIVRTQVKKRYRGSGKLLVWLLGIPVVLMCAWLPVGGAIVALCIAWLAAARGYSVHAQILRESKHGGERKRMDGAISVASAPWHLLHALLAMIPKVLIWALLYVLVNLLVLNLMGVPQTQSSIGVFGHTWVFGLIAGSPRSLSGVTLGITGGLAWLACCLLNSAPSALATGFASAWDSLRRGVAKVRNTDDETEAVADLQAPADSISSDGSAASFDSHGDVTDLAAVGTSSTAQVPQRARHSAWGVALLIFLISFTVASITMTLVAPSIDWSPIITW